jgi:ABC-2 type transport system ATP-binding protein
MTSAAAPPPLIASPALELRDVSKRYGDFTAVDRISLSVPSGSIFGFLGPNGAGKTTTLRMILDIIQPTEGSITLLGSNSALSLRNRIGYLPEEKGLYKKMRAWSVIAYFATLKGLSRAAAKRRAFELLERYGLKDFAEAKTEALSKGMGQKVQVLAAVAHDPDFVILDEPFSGLDPVNQTVMEDIITDLRSRGRTVIFSTHVMAHAERMCDRLAIIARGRKLFDGTPEEARRSIPGRVKLQTSDSGSIESLRALREVASITPGPDGRWEIELSGNANPQAVLEACFTGGIRLRSFQFTEPTLHDVFLKLVGPDAREASFR